MAPGKLSVTCKSRNSFCQGDSLWPLCPFQRQLPIFQNTVNNCDTLRDNFPKGYTETLSQTGVSCYQLLLIIINRTIFYCICIT